MSICKDIQEKYHSLTKSQKKVADYILSNQERAAMKTTINIATEVGVSDTTIIRLAYALGYDGFNAMQKQIQEDVLESNQSRKLENIGEQNDYQKVLSRQIELLLEMRDQAIDFEQLQSVAQRISSADHVMVFGYYGEHTVAYQLYFMLDSIQPNVHYYRENTVGLRELSELNPKSVVIAMAFPPYSEGTVELVQLVQEKGCQTVVITNSTNSPIAKNADEVIVFPLEKDSVTGINCMAPVSVYTYILMLAVKNCNPQRAEYRIKNVQSQLVQPGSMPPKIDTGWNE